MGAFPGAICALAAREGFTFGNQTEGPVVVPSRRQGAHGYHPTSPDEQATFIAAGDGIRPGVVLKQMQMIDIAPTVAVVVGDDAAACRDLVKPRLALYIGGMGARGKNFYNDLACRYGYEGEAKRIQELYLAGRKEEATAAVPDRLVDEVALCGPRERIRERLEAWKASGVTTLNCATGQLEAVRTMAELAL